MCLHIGTNNDKHEKTAIELLRQCTGLRRLEITVRQAYNGNMSPLEWTAIEELRKLRGCEEVNFSLRPFAGARMPEMQPSCTEQEWNEFVGKMKEDLCKEREVESELPDQVE